MTLKDQLEKQEREQLDKAIEWAGSRALLGSVLGVSHQVVYGWIKRGRISATAAAKLEKISQGKLKKSEMRPDVSGWYL